MDWTAFAQAEESDLEDAPGHAAIWGEFAAAEVADLDVVAVQPDEVFLVDDSLLPSYVHFVFVSPAHQHLNQVSSHYLHNVAHCL